MTCIKYMEQRKKGLPLSRLTMNGSPGDQLGTAQLLKR